MKKRIVFISPILLLFTSVSCSNNKETLKDMKDTSSGSCEAKSNSAKLLSCKLTTPELRQRKETLIASIKTQVMDKKELLNGYAFRFNGSDTMIDELIAFIKTERECCGFFTFNLSIAGDKSETWLELKGEQGVKDFITSELEL